MSLRALGAVIRKDLTVVLRSRMILLPMILLPLILQVGLPVGLGLMVRLAPEELASSGDLEPFLENVPQSVLSDLESEDESPRLLLLLLVYLFAPLYLIIPMMVSSVIAADSFAGERERKTLEALLHTPLTDFELIVAKMLSAWIAAILVSLGSFLLYSLAINAIVGRAVLPNVLWIALVVWVAPAAAGTGLTTTVLISSRVSSFQEAYQLGAVVVIPLVGVLIAQVAGVFFLSLALALLFGLALWALNLLLLFFGLKTFRREELLVRM